MILQTSQLNGGTLASIQLKEANLASSEGLKTELAALIDAGDKYIIIDFEKVIYVDSSFLGGLVSSLKYAISNGADIVVVNLNKDIKSLFQLIRLDKVFKIYNTVDEAIAKV